jgi:hypothetical protein
MAVWSNHPESENGISNIRIIMHKTLAKGLTLLEMLATHPKLDGGVRLGRGINWSRSNVHRTL